MKKTIQVLNGLVRQGLLEGYAVGGAVATLFYMEPTLTYDLDVFVFLPPSREKLLSLAPIYEALKTQGYQARQEHVVIEGVPVQLIPAYNRLVEEAVKEAKTVRYQGVKTRVLLAEHLAAIMLQTARPKDQARLAQLLEGVSMNRGRLEKVLERHGLSERWRQFKRRFRED
jgi:hypothetical protein